MSPYILDVLFLIFGIITVIICAKRGFFLTLLKFFKLLLSVVAAYLWGSAFGNFLGESFLNQPIRNSVFNKVNSIYLNAADSFNAESALEAVPSFLLNDELQAKITSLNGSGEALVNSITDTISEALSSVICAVLGYAAVFLIAFIALSIVYLVVKGLRSKIMILDFVDGLLGAVLGFVWAFVILMVVGSVLKFFCAEQDLYAQSVIVKFFGESALHDALSFLDIDKWLSTLQNAAGK